MVETNTTEMSPCGFEFVLNALCTSHFKNYYDLLNL